jgi:hypothetical protein
MSALYHDHVCGQAHIQSVKEIVTLGLRFCLEDFDILEHLRIDLDLLVESHRVFTQEVKDDLVGRFESDVFVSQGTTTDSIRLVFSLLVSCSEGESVYEVKSGGSLSLCGDLRLEVLGVDFSDLVDVFLRVSVNQLSPLTMSSRAFSNFARSLWPFHDDPADRKTYFA